MSEGTFFHVEANRSLDQNDVHIVVVLTLAWRPLRKLRTSITCVIKNKIICIKTSTNIKYFASLP